MLTVCVPPCRRAAKLILPLLLAVVIVMCVSSPAFAQPQTGGEAQLILPDLSQANFLGGTAPDISATVATGTGDFIGINDGNLTFTTGSFNQVGSPAIPLYAQLGPLQNNGGPLAGAPTVTQTVPTLAPLPGSPVIDRGINIPSLPATDQRGFLRIVNAAVDVGAWLRSLGLETL